uniref:Uncharacterized protein n=1 Tax=Triticum urartu TaxID=4572 RepID=A0A8R7TTR9_TRIUA
MFASNCIDSSHSQPFPHLYRRGTTRTEPDRFSFGAFGFQTTLRGWRPRRPPRGHL